MNTLLLRYDGPSSLLPAAEILKRGGLVAFPTETVYGLGGNALNEGAAAKIYEAKGRPSDNPLIVHLSDASEAGKYAVTSPLFEKLAAAFMPGPLTVILPKKACIPDSVTGGLPTVGIRVPSNPVARELISLAGCPIAAPSANLSGKPSPTSFAHVVHDLDGRVDCIIDGGEAEYGVESTIVSLDGASIKLLRPGAITPEMLSLFTDDLYIDPAVTEKYDGIPLAPGMKYRHYAPSSPVTVLDGSDEDVYAFLKGKERVGIICYEEDLPHLTGECLLSCGPKNNSITQAKLLFACLRSLDGLPSIDAIYARMPSREGIGLAVYNRLLKASGFHVLTL